MGANAQTTVPTFTASQVLTADQQNQSARTGVPVFASTTTRDAAFGGAGEKTLAEGQLCYVENLTGVAQIQYYDGAAWVSLSSGAVVQVKSATKSDTFTTTSTSFTDVTGLSVSITPTSASNNVLVLAAVNTADPTDGTQAFVRLMRDTTAIGVGDTAGNRVSVSAAGRAVSTSSIANVAINFVDSPATTSATTYKIQMQSSSGSSVFVNRSNDDGNTSSYARTISTIVVMEVTP